MEKLRLHDNNFEEDSIKHVRLNRLHQKKDEEIAEIHKKFIYIEENGASQENFEDLK